MMNTKKLIKMAKKWQQRAALHRRRISFHRSSTSSSTTSVEKGCFVVYTADQKRFAFPLKYLNNSTFQELLKVSEEEFGLPGGGTNYVAIRFCFRGVSLYVGRTKDGWRHRT